MNLSEDTWIPVIRERGKRGHIAPWQLTEPDDPIISLACRRPDFNGALMQFLIGLLQMAAAPKDQDTWGQWLERPPEPDQLKQHFESYSEAFNLDGDGPRFMQDHDELDTDQTPIGALLIDAPGANTLRQNADHFIKRGAVEELCLSCVAMALYTLQTNAPSGGAGHRTSLRGGGPLTTLVMLDPKGSGLTRTLWRNLWLNVLEQRSIPTLTGNTAKTAKADIFPWLAKTQTSEPKTGGEMLPGDTHPLQMYWAMPRRIRVDFSDSHSGQCDLCGQTTDQLVHQYKTVNYGINYNGAWQHPLSPHYIDQKTGEPFPVHTQPGGLTYRHWLGLMQDSEHRISAHVVGTFQEQRALPEKEQLRVTAFGYDMDNMKARCWYETSFPLYLLREDIRSIFAKRVAAMIDAAVDVAGKVRSCIKEAWFKRPGDVRGDTGFLVESFFHHTERDFYSGLRELIATIPTAGEKPILHSWHATLREAALELFDYWAARGAMEYADPRRIAKAHEKLQKLMYTKHLRELLQLPSHRKKAA